MAVGPHDPLEGSGRIDERRWLCVGPDGGFTRERLHLDVVQVHVRTDRDGVTCEADDLAVTADRGARRERLDRHLVAARDALTNALDDARQRRADRQILASQQHVVDW